MFESHSFLHYELCYYQAIEYAIKNDLKKVEAGAQGDHKVSRGYEPVITNSLHWFLNETFGAAIENYLIEEKKLIDIELKEILKHLPYKKLDENNGSYRTKYGKN